MSTVTESRRIRSISLGGHPTSIDAEDELALDEPVCIFVNGEYDVTLIATPEMRGELAAGYLLTQGIIESVDEIEAVEIDGGNVKVELTGAVDLREASVSMMNLIVTACGSSPRATGTWMRLPEVSSGLRVEASRLKEMITALNSRSSVHRRTGGTHAAMLCSGEGEVLAFAEDVGRHNAVDKVIGAHALKGGDLGECVLLSTGRQSGEMVQKACRVGIPVIASMTVPLVSGVRLAEASGLTLTSLGGGRLRVYSGPQRIMIR
jgi:FdhD protein